MFSQKWNEWVNKYGLENTVFAVGSIECMKSITVRYSFNEMVEGYERALNEIEL